MMNTPRVRVEVCPQHQALDTSLPWKVTINSATTSQHYFKWKALLKARLVCRRLVRSGEAVTLKIKGRDGKIVKNGERTYPRSSDPKDIPG